MKVSGVPTRALEAGDDRASISVIDQTLLPGRYARVTLRTSADVARAIRDMVVRGAPLIGVTGAFGLAFALREDASAIDAAFSMLVAARPTAVNLKWALERVRAAVAPLPLAQRAGAAFTLAAAMADDDVAACRSIAQHGLPLLERAWEAKGRSGRLNVLTHCNAGWLATVDWGTALSPVFLAHDRGIPVHVWVDETRPRNQGYLTAWELREHGVPHTVIVDNAGGLLMRRGQVDLCLVGTDRTTRTGDVCNKIGTYLKALAAKDNGVPFYVAAPLSSIDPSLDDGAKIVIEERDAREVTHLSGVAQLSGSEVSNPGFDVTPARLVSGLITERGVCGANEESIARMLTEERA